MGTTMNRATFEKLITENIEAMEKVREHFEAEDLLLEWEHIVACLRSAPDREYGPKMIQCPDCAGCGQVANDEDKTPWKYWLDLPLGSSAAVVAGIVRPLKCERCDGSGKVGKGDL